MRKGRLSEVSATGGYGGTRLSGVDAKGRFTLPVDLRHIVREESGGQNEVYFQHEDGFDFLHGYGESFRAQQDQWIEERARAALERGEPFNRHLEKQRTFGNAVRHTFDEAGRFALDPVFADLMGVDDCLLFVGASDTFTVWNPLRFLESAGATQYQRRACEIELKNWRDGTKRPKRAG